MVVGRSVQLIIDEAALIVELAVGMFLHISIHFTYVFIDFSSMDRDRSDL